MNFDRKRILNEHSSPDEPGQSEYSERLIKSVTKAINHQRHGESAINIFRSINRLTRISESFQNRLTELLLTLVSFTYLRN